MASLRWRLSRLLAGDRFDQDQFAAAFAGSMGPDGRELTRDALLSSLKSPASLAAFAAPRGSMTALWSSRADTVPPSPSQEVLQRAYAQHEYVYPAVSRVASAVARTPLRFWHDSGDEEREEVREGPAYEALCNVNRVQTQFEFWESTVTLLYTGGEVGWLLDHPNPSEAGHVPYPKAPQLFVANMALLDLKKDDQGFPDYWLWKPDGKDPVRFDLDEVVHLQFTNPEDPLRGLSPLVPAQNSIAADFYAQQYNAQFFKRGAQPTATVEHPSRPRDPGDVDFIRKMFEEQYAGVENAHRIVFLFDGMKYVKTGLSPRDVEFARLREMSRESITACVGPPPALVGIFRYANYANCIPGYVRVTLSSGVAKPVAEVQEGDVVVTYDDRSNLAGAQRVLKKWSAGTKRILEVRTTNRTLHASEGHKVLRLAPGLNPSRPRRPEWTEMGVLEPGDYIAVYVQGRDASGSTLPDGTEVTVDLAEQLGLFLGDGNISRSNGYMQCLRFAMPDDDEHRGYYMRQAARVWKTKQPFCDGRPVKIRNERRQLIVQSRQPCELIVACGLDQEDHAAKAVPDWLFGLRSDLKQAFLRGVMAADGSVGKNGRVTIAMRDLEIVRRLRELCISVGWAVSNIASSERQSNFGPNELHRFVVSRGSGSVRKFANHPLGENFEWCRVRFVTEIGEAETFDLEVEGDHNFVADGVLTHNSQMQQEYFWTWVVCPLLSRIEQALTKFFVWPLMKDTSYSAEFDVSEISVLQEDRDAVEARFLKQWQMNLATKNEVRADLDREPVTDGTGEMYYADTVEAAKANFGLASTSAAPAALQQDAWGPMPRAALTEQATADFYAQA
jgi:HK97 family phage portal protein